MMTVRFSTGISIEYAKAIRVRTEGVRPVETDPMTYTHQCLYSDADCTQFIARLPLDCIVEAAFPSCCYNCQDKLDFARHMPAPKPSKTEALRLVAEKIREFRHHGGELARIKTALKDFNMHTLSWKSPETKVELEIEAELEEADRRELEMEKD